MKQQGVEVPSKMEDAMEDVTDEAKEDLKDSPEQEKAEEAGEPTKDTPLSIRRRQKKLAVGKEASKEMPLVMYLQQTFDISQKSAQQVSKALADYFKKRKIPVAEGIRGGIVDRVVKRMIANDTTGLLKEATDISRLKSSMFGTMRLVTGKKTSEDTKNKAASYVIGLHSVAKSGDIEKFKGFLQKRYKSKVVNWDKMEEEDLKGLMDYVLKSDQFEKYHKASFDYRQGKKASKAQKKKDIRAIGKNSNSVGKIITRYLGDNPKVIDDDEKLKAIMDDPKQFQKFSKSVRNLLMRMMKRRGYEKAELAKILETVNSELKAIYRENKKAAVRSR